MQFDAVAQAPEVAGVLAVPPPPPPPQADKPKVANAKAVKRRFIFNAEKVILTPKYGELSKYLLSILELNAKIARI